MVEELQEKKRGKNGKGKKVWQAVGRAPVLEEVGEENPVRVLLQRRNGTR